MITELLLRKQTDNGITTNHSKRLPIGFQVPPYGLYHLCKYTCPRYVHSKDQLGDLKSQKLQC